MTDELMKLGGAEVIKALECCTLGTFACGKECPYYSIKSNLKVTSCRFELMCELSDLINRKNSELAELNNLLKLSNDIQNEFCEKIDEQKAEIERLEEMLDCSVSNERNTADNIPYERAEAIKEFAERLCEGRVSNDPVVIAVKAELKMTEQRKEDEKND